MRLSGICTTEGKDPQEISIVVDSLPFTLGRMLLNEDDGTISREHARISWSEQDNAYQVTCLSKNAIMVNQNKIVQNESAILQNMSAMKIGGTKFYVCYPEGTTTPNKKGKKRKSEERESPPNKMEPRTELMANKPSFAIFPLLTEHLRAVS